jgi:hypothetical protein
MADLLTLPGHNLKGVAGFVGGGWQWSGIVTYQSGEPQYIREGFCQWRCYEIFPKLLHDSNTHAPHTRQEWFDTTAFGQPGPNQYGDVAANTNPIGPDNKTVNMVMAKFFPIKGETKIEFRAEAYNTFNWTNLGNVAGTRGYPSFGQIYSAGPARAMQFALKLQF